MVKRVTVAMVGVVCLGIGSIHGAALYETGFEQGDATGPFALGTVEGQGNPAWAKGFFGGDGGQVEDSGDVVNTEVFDGAQSLHLFGNNIQFGETSRVTMTAGMAPQWIEFAFRIEDAFAGRRSSFRVISGAGVPGNPVGMVVEFYSDGRVIKANGTDVGQFVEKQWHTISFDMEKLPHYGGDYDVYLDGGFIGAASFNASQADNLRGIVFAARFGGFSPGNNWFVDGIQLGDEMVYIPEPATLALLSLGGLCALRRRR